MGEPRRADLEDTIETRLDEIHDRLSAGDDRMSRIESKVDGLIVSLQGVPEHLAAVCRVAQAAGLLIAPIVWVVRNIRRALVWGGSIAAAVYAIWTLAEKAGWM